MFFAGDCEFDEMHFAGELVSLRRCFLLMIR